MVHIVDAIMGAGKSQSAISYMNDHPDERFIYITPYIDEAARIQSGCPSLHFVTPSQISANYNHSKVEHTKSLMRQGRNVATTHAAFRLYTEDMISSIKEWGYTLIIDEAVNVLSELEVSKGDIDLLLMAGMLKKMPDGSIVPGENEYTGTRLADLCAITQHSDIIQMDDRYYFWELHSHILSAFRDVYVLTYLFDGQDMSYYLRKRNIPYVRIGVERTGDTYHFSESTSYMPPYTQHLSELIHICDNEKLNSIGADRYALSSTWYEKASSKAISDLRNNLFNYFHNIMKAKSKEVLWTSFKNYESKLSGPGYTNGFISCTLRATNEYRSRKYMAYCVNGFANPFKHRYLSDIGSQYDDDIYALSNMVQWIWRSQIRDGKEIWIYVPSERMRSLLVRWIMDVEDQYYQYANRGDTNEGEQRST